MLVGLNVDSGITIVIWQVMSESREQWNDVVMTSWHTVTSSLQYTPI